MHKLPIEWPTVPCIIVVDENRICASVATTPLAIRRGRRSNAMQEHQHRLESVGLYETLNALRWQAAEL